MDASFSDSEELLRETARRIGADFACESVTDYDGYDSSTAWTALAKLGLLGMRWSPDASSGASTLDEAIVVESLAHSALAVPYMGSAAFVSGLLMAAHAPDETMIRLANGELRCAVAMNRDLTSMWSTTAQTSQTPVAFDSAGAQAALILDSKDGLRLRSVALGEAHQPLDITRRSNLVDVSEPVDVGSLGGEIERGDFERTIARFLVLLCADLVGVMEAGLEAAVSYASTREQFGVPIATFQAVQHICADQLVSIEAARSLTEYAAWAIDECDTVESLLAAQSAKAYASRVGRSVCEAVLQVHGGVAFTWDYMAHVYLKRALADGLMFGDSSTHFDAITKERQTVAS